MTLPSSLRSALGMLGMALPPLLVVAVSVSLGVLFHVRGERAVESQLRERMLNVVAIAAPYFEGEQITAIRGPEDMETENYRTVVTTLQNIRAMSPRVRFAYIMRRTENPLELAFVADADAALTSEQLDVNGNGTVDPDEEAAYPGDLYDIEGSETLLGPAFEGPVVDNEITEDQWGRLVSAYAPIRNAQGEVVAILGIDIGAEDFYAMTQGTFSLVAVLLVGLVGTLLGAYFLIILRKRRMEAMSQLDAERTALLDLATHQLGMPLATFRWWVELLKESKGKGVDSEDAILQLQEGVERMDKVLRALTEVTQLRDDAFSFKPMRVEVQAALDRAITDLGSQLTDRGQSLAVDLEKDLPAVVLDDKLLGGILHELIQNASFYSPEGRQIVVRARRDGRNVQIDVVDTGYGIPDKDIPYIFEKFRRGSNAASHRPVGNGLGLYITKRVVEKAKGKVRVTSRVDNGTTVSLILPVAR